MTDLHQLPDDAAPRGQWRPHTRHALTLLQRMLQPFSDLPRSLLFGIFVAFALMVIRVATTPSPVMGGDEYAYFGTAKYGSDIEYIHRFDPGMQAVDNKMYPVIYGVWNAIAPKNTEIAARILQSLIFVLSAVVLYFTFIGVFDRRSALYSAILYLVLPLSFYATLLLPEVELQILVYLVALVVAISGGTPRYSHVFLTAVLGALAYFAKPHAVALILASAAYWFLTGWVTGGASAPARLRIAALRVTGYVLPVALIIVLGNRAGASSVGGGSIVPSFYQSYLGQLIKPDFLVAGIGGFFDYFLGHAWVLMALFAPGMLLTFRAGWRMTMRATSALGEPSDETADRANLFAAFVLLLLVAFVGMIAMFTVSATAASEFEKYRLHGRYLAPVLPLLLGCSVWAVGRSRLGRAPLLGMVALAMFVLVGRGLYKIFPWDYPEIFGFFGGAIRYWSFQGSLPWTVWLILVCGVVAYSTMQVRLNQARFCYIAFVATWAIASQLQMARWLAVHVEDHRVTESAADAIEAYLGGASAGSGLVITFDRYGDAPFLLMGFDHIQHVKSVARDVVITDVDLPAGVSWIVAPREAVVQLPGFEKHTFGTQIVYQRK